MMSGSERTSVEENDVAVLEVRGLSKGFGGVRALDSVSMRVRAGQVTALVGENGAGKSTLIKCLAGAHQPDLGQILVEGHPITFTGPFGARDSGIETVHQDLALTENLDVTANIFLGREVRHAWYRGFALKKRAMRAQSEEMLANFGINVPSVRTEVRNLSGGQRQGVAIARATGWGTRVIIMDEPTAALGVHETQRVLELITELAEKRLGVLVVSHNLDEVLQISDHIWVLRRGKLVTGLAKRDTSHEELVQYITGLAAANDEEQE